MPFFYTGTLALFAAWVLSLTATGCRFGNHSEYKSLTDNGPVSAQKPSDGITGYYHSTVASVTVCGTPSNANTRCVAAPANQVPYEVASVMTDPVGVMLADPQTREGYLLASDGTGNYVHTAIGSDQVISYGSLGSPRQLWLDPACTTSLELEESGKLVPQETTIGTVISKGAKKSVYVYGRVQLTLQVIRTIDGNCTTSLQQIHDCYMNRNNCGGATDDENTQYQQVVQQTFGMYIDSGAITADDLRTLRNVAYEVVYE